MSRKPKRAARREPTPEEEGAQILANAEKAGANYAQDQVDGSYFRDWVMDQMVEGEEMRKRDPNSVIPLETPSDAKKLARNMLQQLEWDTKRDMEQSTVLELSGTDDGDLDRCGVSAKEVNDAFFSAFTESLKNPTTVHWLTGIILENLDEVRGTPKSKLARELSPGARNLKSHGHIGFDGDWEYFEINGEVFRAPRSAPLADIRGPAPRRHGRWESSRSHFERYRQHIAPGLHERPMVRAISPARHLANDIVRAIMKEPGILPYSLATRFGLEGRVASEILNLAPSSFGPGGEGFESYAKKVEKIILRKRVIRDVPRRPVVRDYIAVDPRGRTVAGPFTDYSDAKQAATRARGFVKFASGVREDRRRPVRSMRPRRRPR